MVVSKFMAQQYSKPSGWFGQLLMGSLLNRSNSKSNAVVYNVLAPRPEARVLEIGFGGGELLFRIAKILTSGSIHGVETSKPMLDRANAAIHRLGLCDKVHVHRGTIENLPFSNEHFDFVCSVNTIYFWPDLSRGVNELARVTRKSGVAVLGFGSDTALRQSGYEDQGFNLYSPDQIVEALNSGGFCLDKLETLNRKTRGPFFVSRSIKR